MNTANIELNEEQREAMCDWIYECGDFEDNDDEEDARQGGRDAYLLKFIQINYEGGLKDFFETM